MLIYFKKYYSQYFWAIIAISIYGISHEIWKLGQGGFLLAIFLSIYFNRQKNKQIVRFSSKDKYDLKKNEKNIIY